ncbi:major vault protein-like [Syngnathus typhle]
MMAEENGNRPREPDVQVDTSIILPHHYLHVLDQNTCIIRVEIGPQAYRCQDNERVLFPPMINVPPGHYCVVKVSRSLDRFLVR